MSNFNQHYGLEGHFRMVRRKADTGEVVGDTGWFPNLITNGGLNRLGTGDPWAGGCVVGTGNATPLPTDTTLQAFRARTTVQAANPEYPYSTTSPYWSGSVRGWRFAEGAAAGNLTEVGVTWTLGTNPAVFSRALIKDALGKPTTLTVLSNEILDVFYELRVYMQETDTVSPPINLLGTNHVFTMRAGNISGGGQYAPVTSGFASIFNNMAAYAAPLAANTSLPSGASAPGSVASQTYIDGSLQKTFVLSFSITQGNIAGDAPHQSYRLYSSGSGALQYQIGISPPFAKNSTKALNFTVTISWARKGL